MGTRVAVPSRCDYCDFATWTYRTHLVDAYVEACIRDIERRDLPPATSVFFGGGTPSLLAPDSLVRMLEAIPCARDAEVTVECNPDSVDADKLGAYAAGGVNRLSFGVQSMRAHVLAALGRTHDPANVERAMGWARDAGFTRINLDLIYGTPGERVADWEATLEAALALGPSHVSAYALTVEAGTPLARAVAAGDRSAPDDDDQADKYEIADDRLRAAGFGWYEVSNWSQPGDECRHNLLYWAQGEYVGIGCAAHGHTLGGGRGERSHEARSHGARSHGARSQEARSQEARSQEARSQEARRWWNVRTPERYVAAVDAGVTTEAGSEWLGAHARAEERLVLGLRTRFGAGLSARELLLGPLAAAVRQLETSGLVDCHVDGLGVWLVLTRRGRLLGNEVASRLLAARDATVRAGTR